MQNNTKLSNYSNYILKNIDLDIDEIDDNLIILGSNGSGKTTLAKAISNLLQNDFKSISDPSHINYIPTKLEIFDEYMRVGEFLSLSQISSKSDISIDEVLEIFDISYLKNRFCQNISSGEAQLVLISSAILHDAYFTILDEPTSNLDPIKTHKIFETIKANKYLQKKILITHDLNLAYHLGYGILYLKEGNVVFHGSNQDFFSQSHLDTIFDGFVIKKDDDIVVKL